MQNGGTSVMINELKDLEEAKDEDKDSSESPRKSKIEQDPH